MPISPGEPWGDAVAGPVDGPLSIDDHTTARLVAAGREPVVRGGDLALALGVVDGTDPSLRLPVDVMVLRDAASGRELARGIAHLIVRRRGPLSWLRSRVTVVANTDYVQGRQWLPRAHPNDGVLDRLDVDAAMSIRQRYQAMRRARAGNHLPHPCMRATRGERFDVDVDRRARLWLDGQLTTVRGTVVVEVLVDGGAVNI